jgi:hypothetical protein
MLEGMTNRLRRSARALGQRAVTATVAEAAPDVRFFTRALRLRLVKKAALPPAFPEPATRPR